MYPTDTFGLTHSRVEGYKYDTWSGKKLWNSYFRLTSQIYPCLFRLMVHTLFAR
ncbi:hypothetical protein L873DRAFT_1813248 [Choiromyces venosus 120613-1]|uniref:Uncharacterized protein n=1 Tax=Choiromyces venosus 120613-1 TaxID=1336337 RepID=A0A3N4J9Y8_9PEZI|nr:hypothetical protein L873DRAFT_1813248 [Choiromyces venosus 120613-1]